MNLLLGAALAGLAAGFVRARADHRPYQVDNLRWAWLVIMAVVPQLFAFVLPTRSAVSTAWLPFVLVGSQTLLLLFAISNIRRAGFWLLGLGLVLNLTVILLNGGLMPISPETILHLFPNADGGSWQIGQRFGVGKDVVLPFSQTTLWFLSDWLYLPDWTGIRVAFSPGDVLIAGGAFWMLFSFGGRPILSKETSE